MSPGPAVLLLPGYGDSGPAHWQSIWEARHPSARRVVQDDWEAPVRSAWVARLAEAVDACAAPPVLAAHSIGCLAVAHWAVTGGDGIAGALLVAVPDPAGPAFPGGATGFAPVPLAPLPFPAVVVASDDDPYASPGFARDVAARWGAELRRIGARGHINADSGLDDWADGWELVRALAA